MTLPGEIVQALQQGRLKLVDLTYTLDEQSPGWPEDTLFHTTTSATFEHDGFFTRNLQLPEHSGTHMDAPLHIDPQGKSVEQIPVPDLLLEAAVVDVRAPVSRNADYRLSAEDLQNWEKSHGPLPPGGALLALTGWGERWPSQIRYMNQDAQGVLHFPGFSLEAAHYLLEHARPKALGIDTASIDYGPSRKLEVHQLTMRAGLYHLENLANLDKLPATGAVILSLPLKLGGGSAAPTRVIALLK